MSISEFVEGILEENKEELEELRKLQEILDQLSRREPRIYSISVTSNL